MSARLLASLPLLFLAAACARSPVPCTSAGVCTEGRECLAHRCVPEGYTVATTDARRLVCEADGVSLLDGTLQLPSAGAPLRLDPRAGEATVLHFTPRWQTLREIEAAFLVVFPASAAPARLELSAVEKHPLGGRRLASTRRSGTVRGGGPLRVDVTDIVRSWRGGAPALGLALQSANDEPLDVHVASTERLAPRLELYGR